MSDEIFGTKRLLDDEFENLKGGFFFAALCPQLASSGFDHILVMKTSSAGETMDVVTIEIFDHFWDRVKFGYAAAEGVVLFIILNVLAISQYVIFRKRLNYD